MNDLTLKGSFFISCIDGDKPFAIEFDIYGKERYFFDGNLIEEFNAIGKGKNRTKVFQLCNKKIEIHYNFKKGEYKSIALVDGKIVANPLFKELDEMYNHKTEKNYFMPIMIFFCFIILLFYYF